MVLAFLLLIVLAVISLANAEVPHVRLRRKPGITRVPLPDRPVTPGPNGTSLPPLGTVYQFEQPIDHNDTGRGTFKQRYWVNWEFYERGGPIILLTPGESNAGGFLGYLTNSTICGQIAQQQQGATVILEHRFFGESNPYDNLHSWSLEFLTIEQAIEDLVYFTQNVELPFPSIDIPVKPINTSWVLVGGSYSGALTSWTMVSKPGIFRAGFASSAVVEAIVDFYGYFTPIRENMPQNCSADVEAVVAYLDQIYAKNDTNAIQTLKNTFGLGNLTHVDDFAAALQYNLFDWQGLQPISGPGALFYQFCDALEVKKGVSASASGWGLENAISSWGSFWNNTYYKLLCGEADAETCLGTYDRSLPYWTNVTVGNSARSWDWLQCNQIGSWASGPPEGQPAIVSRILQPIYNERLCTYMFPQKFPVSQSPSAEMTNTIYKGWDVSVDRLFFGTGRRDPWLEETVSAEGRHKANTTNQSIIYESDGFHTSDMVTGNGFVDDTIHTVQIAILEHMKEWLA